MESGNMPSRDQVGMSQTSPRAIITVFIISAAVGLLTSLLYLAFSNFVFGPTLCAADADELCYSASLTSSIIAYVIGALVGLVALIINRIYRPLLVVLAVTIGLWCAPLYMPYNAWMFTAILVGMFISTYGLMYWFSLLKNFYLSAGLITVLIFIIQTSLRI